MSWLDPIEAAAPDVVACWRVMDYSPPGLAELRRELAGRVHDGDAGRILAQQEAIGDALEATLRGLPERALRAPGGEADWNVAQAFAHTTGARRFLASWAALDAAGHWPESQPPQVVPSLPGRPDADRAALLTLLDKSRVALREAAARIAGHETDLCRLDHPLVGHLRCGDWLLFVGVHDLMHLEQLHRLGQTGVPGDGARADPGPGSGA
jgi:DinB superfamily